MKKFCVTILFVFQTVQASQPVDAIVLNQKDISNRMITYAQLRDTNNHGKLSIRALNQDVYSIDRSKQECANSLEKNHEKITEFHKRQVELQETLKLHNDLWWKEYNKEFNAQRAIESFQLSLQRFEKLLPQQQSQEVLDCRIPGIVDKNSLMNYLQIKANGHFIQEDEAHFNQQKEINLNKIESLRAPFVLEIQEIVANKKMFEGEQRDVKTHFQSYDALFLMYKTLRDDQAKIKRADFLQQCLAKYKLHKLRNEAEAKKLQEKEQVLMIAEENRTRLVVSQSQAALKKLAQISLDKAEREQLQKIKQDQEQIELDKKEEIKAKRIAQSKKDRVANNLRRQALEKKRLEKIEQDKKEAQLEAERLEQLEKVRLQKIEDEKKIAEQMRFAEEQRAREQSEKRMKRRQDRDEQKKKEQAAQEEQARKEREAKALKAEQDRIAKQQAEEKKQAEDLARKKKAQEDAKAARLVAEQEKIEAEKAAEAELVKIIAANELLAKQQKENEQAEKKKHDEAAALKAEADAKALADKREARHKEISDRVAAARAAAAEKEAQEKATAEQVGATGFEDAYKVNVKKQSNLEKVSQGETQDKKAQQKAQKDILAQQASLNRAVEINLFEGAFQERFNEFKRLEESGKKGREIASLMLQYDHERNIFRFTGDFEKDKKFDLQIIAAIKHLLTLSFNETLYLANLAGVIRGININLNFFGQSIHQFFASEHATRNALALKCENLKKVCGDNDIELLKQQNEKLILQGNGIEKHIERFKTQVLSNYVSVVDIPDIETKMNEAYCECCRLNDEYNKNIQLIQYCQMRTLMESIHNLINPAPKS